MLPATTAKRSSQPEVADATEPLQVARRCIAARQVETLYARTPSTQRSTQRLKHGRRRPPHAAARPVGPHGRALRGRPRAALRARRAGAGAVPEPAAAARAHGKLCRRRPVAARKHTPKTKATVAGAPTEIQEPLRVRHVALRRAVVKPPTDPTFPENCLLYTSPSPRD